MNQIPQSLLDTDLYTFSVQNAILDHFYDARAEYRFVNRGYHKITPQLIEALKFQVYNVFPSIYLTDYEYHWLKSTCKHLKPWYFEYLKNYRFNPEEVKIEQDGNETKISVIGPWHSTIMWEVPLLYTISQLYHEIVDNNWSMEGQVEKINLKGKKLSNNDCFTADMSTRRRRNFNSQKIVVEELKKYPCFNGTSNTYLAMLNSVKPIGTMSHQWISAMQALRSIRYCNHYAMDYWVKTFGTSLGIMLTDTVTSDCFLKSFSPYFANLFSGTRCDSGIELEYVDKMIKHYKSLNINPNHKCIIFSNSLNVDKAIKIRKYCEGKIGCSFGIGNHLGNDFENSPAPNMVIKLWSINGIPVVKLSDDLGKLIGDKDAVKVTKWECCGTTIEVD
jgi:nicotinate phosphoribosyltransferase